MAAKDTSKKSNQTKPQGEQPEQNPDDFQPGDGLSLSFEEDGLIAKLEVALEYGSRYTQDSLKHYLYDQNVVNGIDLDALRSLLIEENFNECVIVARGVPPEHGKDGYVDWEVDISVLDGAKLIEKGGKVDWKQQHHVLPVKKDQLLATLVPPTNGTSGKDVHGKEIQANQGNPAKLPGGKNIRIDEAGEKMIAEIDGAVSREGEKYVISETYDVQGDVSYESGNVDFHGTVVINGGVLSDFQVKSGQDIHVNGLVEGALLDAKGSIFINGGIQGNQKATIIAGGDITVKYVHNTRLQAMGNVIVNSAITQSFVHSHDRVIVEGPKGTITGGTVYAENEISADVYGAEIGTKTKVILGNDILAFSDRLHQHEKKMKVMKENAQRLDHALQQLNRLRDAGKISPEHEQMRLKLVRADMQQRGQVKKLQGAQDEMKKELELARKKQKGVVVRDKAWAGTTIQVLKETFVVQKEVNKVIFAMPGDEIKQFGYKVTDGKEVASEKQ